MARLIYSAITSLDGYVNDKNGKFDWAVPDEEIHRFVNDLERPIGTHLYGRRLYDTMVYWENVPNLSQEPAVIQDYARIWQAADKIVFSKTLSKASTARTRIERDLDPESVKRMKESERNDLSVGGPELAGQLLKAGLVDEINLFVVPVVVGGGQHSLPDDVHLRLELVDERRFRNGTVHLCYRTRT